MSRHVRRHRTVAERKRGLKRHDKRSGNCSKAASVTKEFSRSKYALTIKLRLSFIFKTHSVKWSDKDGEVYTSLLISCIIIFCSISSLSWWFCCVIQYHPLAWLAASKFDSNTKIKTQLQNIMALLCARLFSSRRLCHRCLIHNRKTAHINITNIRSLNSFARDNVIRKKQEKNQVKPISSFTA